MNKKTKTIVMLVIAIGIWGYSAMEWLNYWSIDNGGDTVPSEIVQNVPDVVYDVKKEYELIADYQDPFLKNGKYKPKQISNYNPSKAPQPNRNNPVKPKVEPAAYLWPQFEYSGTVAGNNKEILGLLKVDGSDRILKKGDVFSGLKVVQVSKESVTVSNGKEEKVIPKK